jgi:chromosome partitioning protein
LKVLAAYNIKGGVGKTATAVNLAHLSSLDGNRTLIWDLDPQGAATFYFRVRAEVKGGGSRLIRGKTDPDDVIRGTDFEGLDILPADFSYRNLDLKLDQSRKPSKRLAQLLGRIEDEYDIVFLDCAPSISTVSESIFVASDHLLVPTIPTTLSLRTLSQLKDHLAKEGPKRLTVLPFFCMVDRRKWLHREICSAEEKERLSMLSADIPYSSYIERMGVRRAPVTSFAPSSAAARYCALLWEEIWCRING